MSDTEREQHESLRTAFSSPELETAGRKKLGRVPTESHSEQKPEPSEDVTQTHGVDPVETSLEGADDDVGDGEGTSSGQSQYEFLPSARDILEEVVPASFKTKLFKCFLDAAVSEQVARMIAMKSATESADDMTRSLSMSYNRARQSQITGEIMEIIGGVEALS